MEPREIDEKLRAILGTRAPIVHAERGLLALRHSLRVKRLMRIVRWPILLAVLAGLFRWISFAAGGGCAPGPPEFRPSDLQTASVKVMYPKGGGAPATTAVDLSAKAERDKLVAAYRSMRPANETGRIVSPDVYLNLGLTGNREIAVVLEKDIPQFVEVRQYESGKLTRTVHVRPGAMFGYLTGASE